MRFFPQCFSPLNRQKLHILLGYFLEAAKVLMESRRMCKGSRDLLLNCLVASQLCDIVFALFGVVRIRLNIFLDCQHRGCPFKGHRNSRDVVPLCILWCIWWERNHRSFEGKEFSIRVPKEMMLSFFYLVFFDLAGLIPFSQILLQEFWGPVFLQLCLWTLPNVYSTCLRCSTLK